MADDAYDYLGMEPARNRPAVVVPEYPPAPSPEPQTPGTRMSEAVILRVAQAVQRFTPVDAALKSSGVHHSLGDIEALAEGTTDPFWPWALETLGIAVASAVTISSEQLYGIAVDADSKMQLQALKLFLETHTPQFQRTKKVEVSTGGNVTHTHVLGRVDDVLLDGSMSIAELTQRVRDRPALEDRGEVVDVTPTETPAVTPGFEVKRPEKKGSGLS